MRLSIPSLSFSYDDISAVFLDKDGTLLDSHFYWGNIILQRSRTLSLHYGLHESFQPLLCRAMGLDPNTFRLLPQGPIALVDRLTVADITTHFLLTLSVPADIDTILHLFKEADALLEPDLPSTIHPLPYSLEFLSHIPAQLKLAIITSDSINNTNIFIRKFCPHQIPNILVIGRESCPMPKHSGGPAKYAADLLDVSITNCLVIGDSPMDFEMATNSGAHHLLVSTGQLPSKDLHTHTSLIVSSLNPSNFHFV